MLITTSRGYSICDCCLARQQLFRFGGTSHLWKSFHQSTPARLPPAEAVAKQGENESQVEQNEEAQEGAMARRLEQMTEEGLEQGGTRAGKIIQQAGFSEELKKKLEARIKDTEFRNEHPAAFAAVDMPSSAGQGTQANAAAQPWTGNEAVQDTALRMLDDAHKPLKGFSKSKGLKTIDVRPKNLKPVLRAERLATARDRTSVYALAQDDTMSEKEKEELRKMFKDRFNASARPIPASVQGLQSLASQRIEDAIARGQFKNIARGKGVNTERDHNADSPFINTTEYFLNKIVKKQELTPPWIEKQAEIHRNISSFRSRLRADWRRHAARTIASKGGSLESQLQRARDYAEAEAVFNPQPSKKDFMSSIDSSGTLTYVQVEEKPTNIGQSTEGTTEILVSEVKADKSTAEAIAAQPLQDPPSAPLPPEKPLQSPFRDPSWLALESPYHKLALDSVNSLTRSYNLMAPDLAKKPYFNLERELKACYADVAPQLAAEIAERAKAPRVKVDVVGHRPGSVLEKFGQGEKTRVFDERKPRYGFKEFWRDLFAKG